MRPNFDVVKDLHQVPVLLAVNDVGLDHCTSIATTQNGRQGEEVVSSKAQIPKAHTIYDKLKLVSSQNLKGRHKCEHHGQKLQQRLYDTATSYKPRLLLGEN